MKNINLDLLFFGLSMLCFAISGLAAPVSIFYGLHEWVINDVEFKYALFDGFNLWLKMVFGGLVGGLVFWLLGNND